MKAHSTMTQDLYFKTWTYLFKPGTMYDWACERKMTPKVRSQMYKFGNLTPGDLESALYPGDGPTLKIVQATDMWADISSDEIQIAFRFIKSYEMGFLPEDEFRDMVVLPAIVAWHALAYDLVDSKQLDIGDVVASSF